MKNEVKQAYLDKMSADLREITAKVEVVKARVAKGSAEIRLEYHKRIEKWNATETILKKKMDDLRTVGVEGYEAMKTGVQSAWNEVTTIMSSLEQKDKNEKH